MSRARDFADLAGSADAGGLTGRNMIINGAMQVAQRGTSTTGVTSSVYGADRFNLQIGSLGTYTVSQSSTAPDEFSNSFKIDCTVADASPAAGDNLLLNHKIEAQNLQHLGYGTSSAKAITLSFYLRSNKTGSIGLVIRQTDNSNKMFSKEVTINAADTWERKTVSIPADTSGVINDDNGTGLDVSWWLNAGSTYSGGSEMTTWGTETNANKYLGDLDIGAATTDEFYITGVQLEVGEQATPFEHRSYGDELARCQRYFQTFSYMNGYTHHLFNTTDAYAFVQLPGGAMRATPSSSLSDTGSDTMHVAGSSKTISSVSVAASRPDGILHKVVLSTTSTAGHAGHYDNSSTPYILITSEL